MVTSREIEIQDREACVLSSLDDMECELHKSKFPSMKVLDMEEGTLLDYDTGHSMP